MAAHSTSSEDIGPFEVVVLVLSVVVLAALVADTFLPVPAEISRVLGYLDTFVCAVFLVELRELRAELADFRKTQPTPTTTVTSEREPPAPG